VQRLNIGKQETKRCPACGARVYEPSHVFCSMKCAHRDKHSTATAIVKEVAVLMRQYRAGNWTEVD